MRISELIDDNKLAYHDELNPKLWDSNQQLLPEVAEHLTKIAQEFVNSLNLPDQSIKDYVFTGSNANYNYTQYSDIDIHILIDYDLACSDGACKISTADCLMAKKTLWNDRHDITIKGHPVEVYASDAKDQLVQDSGCYSILRNEWIKESTWRSVKIDSTVINVKADELASEIDQVIGSNTTDQVAIEELTTKLWKYRQSGLSKGGEFSVENQVFKALRNNGYVDKIRQYAIKAGDKNLSLESLNVPEWEKECWLVALSKVADVSEEKVKKAALNNGWDGKSFNITVAVTYATLLELLKRKPKLDANQKTKTPKTFSGTTKHTGLIFTNGHVMPMVNGTVSNFNGYGDDKIILAIYV